MKKKCYIIAGPNGAGKTTFANEFLPLADSWTVFDTSGKTSIIAEESEVFQ